MPLGWRVAHGAEAPGGPIVEDVHALLIPLLAMVPRLPGAGGAVMGPAPSHDICTTRNTKRTTTDIHGR